MSKCPITNRDNANVMFCLDIPGRSICCMCPAYDRRARLIMWFRDVRWWLKAMLPIGFALILMSVAAMPAAAAHNEAHECPLWIAEQIAKGALGGQYYAVGDRVTWTDGVLVCVFQGSVPKTLFKSRNAAEYLAEDAAAHAATKVSASAASRILGAAKSIAGPSGSSILGIIPCTVYQQTLSWVRCSPAVQQ